MSRLFSFTLRTGIALTIIGTVLAFSLPVWEVRHIETSSQSIVERLASAQNSSLPGFAITLIGLILVMSCFILWARRQSCRGPEHEIAKKRTAL